MYDAWCVLGIFLVSFATGTLYAAIVGLFSGPLQAALYSWPIWVGLFWVLFRKCKLLRYVGFVWVLPVSLIGFELIWTKLNPGMVADKYTSADRSHYLVGRARSPQTAKAEPDQYGAGLEEILIGQDGFRADPESGRGNPPRCRYVLIGDSMIYGSGLPFAHTLGPVLAEMGLPACVFGVTGNSPVDYLATLKFVSERIDPGAQVAFYLYAYNDFVGLNKYFKRGFLSLSNWLRAPFEWAFAFDRWRKSTFMFQRFRGARKEKKRSLWQLRAGKALIRILYGRDPADYRRPKMLNARQRSALGLFFDGVKEASRGRGWHVSMIIHPDDAEVYANLAQRAPKFVDLDPRRAAVLEICAAYDFFCTDISAWLFERALAQGRNPYFSNNRHFSDAGTRMVAEHFAALAPKRGARGTPLRSPH